MNRLIACGLLAAVLCGCASSATVEQKPAESSAPAARAASGHVGTWAVENLPAGARSMTLEMNADGTWVCNYDADQPHRFGGTWSKDDAGHVLLTGEEGQEYAAALLSDDRLLAQLDAVEPPFQFKRIR